MSSGGCSTCLEVIFAVVLPPLGVFFRYGCCSVSISHLHTHPRRHHCMRVINLNLSPCCCCRVQSEFFISLLLTVLCYVPGIVYSLYVILRTPPEPPGIDGERPYDILA